MSRTFATAAAFKASLEDRPTAALDSVDTSSLGGMAFGQVLQPHHPAHRNNVSFGRHYLARRLSTASLHPQGR